MTIGGGRHFRPARVLPPHFGTLDEQVSRRLMVLHCCASDLGRYAFLRELQDNHQTLILALLEQNIRGVAAAPLHADEGMNAIETSR